MRTRYFFLDKRVSKAATAIFLVYLLGMVGISLLAGRFVENDLSPGISSKNG
jgi:hypothetical protein